MKAEIAAWLRNVPEGELIAYHKWDDDPEIFLVGILHKLSDTTAAFQLIDTDGSTDEIETVNLERIHQAHRDSEYLRNLRVLRANQEDVFRHVEPKRDARAPLSIRKALVKAASSGDVIRYWLKEVEDSTYAFVKSVGATTVVLTPVIEGALDGEYILNLDLIRRVGFGGRDNRAAFYIWELRNKKGE